jgi:hypothetical protein
MHFCKKKAILKKNICKKGWSRIFEYEVYETYWSIFKKGHASAKVAWL